MFKFELLDPRFEVQGYCWTRSEINKIILILKVVFGQPYSIGCETMIVSMLGTVILSKIDPLKFDSSPLFWADTNCGDWSFKAIGLR